LALSDLYVNSTSVLFDILQSVLDKIAIFIDC